MKNYYLVFSGCEFKGIFTEEEILADKEQSWSLGLDMPFKSDWRVLKFQAEDVSSDFCDK